MFINNFDPVAIEIFSFEIRWYSLAYVLGILIGWFLAKKIFITDDGLKEKFDDYLTFAILGIIIGGRIGYILLYNFNYYANNILDIFKIWQGGMSFHGGLIGIIIVSIMFCNKNKINFLNFSDMLSVLTPCGLFLGRVANFINSELIGRPTELPWSVVFIKIDDVPRHPSQIYEAILEGIVLFIILNIVFKNKYLNKGITSAFFLILYGLFRLIAEQFREPDNHLGFIVFNLSLGSILSMLMLILGLIMYNRLK